jgi:curved DNA-binding protein CbpA
MPDPHRSSDHFYRLLDVGPDASRDEIVHAYRRLAHGAHPDAHPKDADAERRFREITEAYEVLADPSRRASYDRTRAGQPIRVVVRPGPTGSSRSQWPVHEVASADPAVFLGGQRSPIADVPLRAGPAHVENSSPGASIRGGDAREVLMELIARVFDSWGRR